MVPFRAWTNRYAFFVVSAYLPPSVFFLKRLQATVNKYGPDQVKIWRRSYDIPPPPCDSTSSHNAANDPKYAHVNPKHIPLTESLKVSLNILRKLVCYGDLRLHLPQTTLERVVPYWERTIRPQIAHGRRVIVAAHGNTLRALVKHLDNIPENVIAELNIPTGVPLIYQLDSSFKPIPQPNAISPLQGRYLGNQEDIRARIEGVKVGSSRIFFRTVLK
jgi:2,3-bisphosphoglycerate-dependent phosphoglycerate mutase